MWADIFAVMWVAIVFIFAAAWLVACAMLLGDLFGLWDVVSWL